MTGTKVLRGCVELAELPDWRKFIKAEVMPGRERADTTFLVKELLPSGRVLLHGAASTCRKRV